MKIADYMALFHDIGEAFTGDIPERAAGTVSGNEGIKNRGSSEQGIYREAER